MCGWRQCVRANTKDQVGCPASHAFFAREVGGVLLERTLLFRFPTTPHRIPKPLPRILTNPPDSLTDGEKVRVVTPKQAAAEAK